MRRDRGSFDATDLVVGLILAVIIPVVFGFILAVSGIPMSRSAALSEVVDRSERIDRIPATPAELEAIHTVATKILDENASHFMDKWRKETDNIARIHESFWAMHCLTESRSKFDQFVKEYESSPGEYPQLTRLVTSAKGRLAEIEGYVKELQEGAQYGEAGYSSGPGQ